MIDVDAPDAPAWRDVSDIPVERVNEVRGWYRMRETYSTLLHPTLVTLLLYLLGARVVQAVQDCRGQGREQVRTRR